MLKVSKPACGLRALPSPTRWVDAKENANRVVCNVVRTGGVNACVRAWVQKLLDKKFPARGPKKSEF